MTNDLTPASLSEALELSATRHLITVNNCVIYSYKFNQGSSVRSSKWPCSFPI
jgi:hypothetical protein